MTELLYQGWKDDAWVAGLALPFLGTILMLAGVDFTQDGKLAVGGLFTTFGAGLIALGALNIADVNQGNRANMMWLEAKVSGLLRN